MELLQLASFAAAFATRHSRQVPAFARRTKLHPVSPKVPSAPQIDRFLPQWRGSCEIPGVAGEFPGLVRRPQ